MNRLVLLIVLLFGCIKLSATEVVHKPVISGIENTLILDASFGSDSMVMIDGKVSKIIKDKKGVMAVFTPGSHQKISINSAHRQLTFDLPNKPIPLWMSALPPLLAILLALFFKEVITSLVLGIFSGTGIIGFYTTGWTGIFTGWLQILDTYILKAVVPDPINGEVGRGHISVIVFSIVIGGLVEIISRNGGMMALVKKMSRWAKTAQSGQFVTWLLGVLVFFDDYANTLIVGNTMRPVTDKLKISREKLAYIVDSTAAPVAAIAFITTWIGAELDYIQSGVHQIAEIDNSTSAYGIFLSSLRYSFYPVFTLLFMLILIWKKKDFGPMYKAEMGARLRSEHVDESGKPGEIDRVAEKKEHMFNAMIPVMIMVGGTIAGLIFTGYTPEIWNDASASFFTKLSATIGNSDSYKSLLWSSFSGLTVAVLLTVLQRIATLAETIEWALNGFKHMLGAVSILILAWALAEVTEKLHTSDFMAGLMTGNVSAVWVPAITFFLSALVSFSTGSSWSTMAILYPIMLLSSWKTCMAAGYNFNESMEVFYNVAACVLAGSVLGDHCSPISDTTILSSLASDCLHINHVKTQLPYALTVGVISVVAGTIPATFGVPYWACLLIGLALMYAIVSYFGKMVDN